MKSATEMNVKLDDLVDWVIYTNQGANPRVAFSDDPIEMLRQAYVERGNLLEMIQRGIGEYMKRDAETRRLLHEAGGGGANVEALAPPSPTSPPEVEAAGGCQQLPCSPTTETL